MNEEKKQRLAEALVAIRRTYGPDALHQLGEANAPTSVPSLSTGFAVLDWALGIGGLPKGHLTQVSGIPTSGAMTLACKVLAQAVDEAGVWVDLPQTFDADYAARCGVDTANLVLIQPPSLDQALEMLATLVNTAAAAVLMLDTTAKKPRVDQAAFNRLLSALHRSRCALILVEQAGTPLLSEKAALRLHFQRERWLRQRQDVNGYRTRVRILKNAWGPSGHSVRLTIGFSTVVDGDGA